MTLSDLFWILVFAPLVPLSAFLSRRLFGHWFSPLSMFVGINSLSMTCYHLRLLEMPDVTLTVHVLLLAALFLFGLGVLLALGRRPPELTGTRSIGWDVTGLVPFFYITVALSTVGWVAQGSMLVMKMGLGALLRNIWVLQSEFQVQFVGYLNMIGILVFPTFILRRTIGPVRKLDYALVASALFGLLLAGIKGYLIFSVFGGVYVMSVTRRESFRPKHLALGIAIIIAFFIVYAAKVDIFANEHYEGTGLMKYFPALHMPYLYFVGSWPSLGFVIDGAVADLPRLGTFVLQPMWKIFGAFGLIDYAPLSQPFVNMGLFTFNVYSMVGELYWDLKWPGALGVTFLLGMITTRLYMRVFSSRYWGHPLVYAIMVHGLFMSFFSFIYTFNIYVLLLYTFLVGFVLPRGGVLVRRGSNGGPEQRSDGS